MDEKKAAPERIWTRPKSSPALIFRARELRQEATEAEKILWKALRNCRAGGHKFRRQHLIGKYIADFYCAQQRLVIEIDGAIHDDPQHRADDEWREAILKSEGLRVLRFWNEEVFVNLHNVVESIIRNCNEHESNN